MGSSNYNHIMYKDYEEICIKCKDLQGKNKELNESLAYERHAHDLSEKRVQKAKDKLAALRSEKASLDKEVKALKDEVARLRALLNTDGTNSGLPTSKTPLNKKKLTPNSRVKSGKHRGGQPGHEKSKLEAFDDEEITETVEHAENVCPCCGGTLEPTGNIVTKDEQEYELVEKKIRHVFHECKCAKCGQIIATKIPPHLKEDNQYGPNVQALCLTLMNVGNVPINKVKRIVYGLSEGDMNLSEGYISKLQKRASTNLASFVEETKEHCKKVSLLHWDDTVIDINTNRGCLRFYGNENVALYAAHSKKDKVGLDEDGILSALPETTTVVHDHNTVNYNDDYGFQNAECCAHLLRDLEKINQISHHPWAEKMKDLFSKTDVERNEEIEKGSDSFSDERMVEFATQFDTILLEGYTEQAADKNRYYSREEKALLNRLMKYKDNYCMWVMDFEIPFTNNLAERGLRGAKTKMKVSGQFFSVKNAQYYADIKTYMETCRRNKVNEMIALQRLCMGNPFTLKEILEYNNDVT